MNKLFITSSAIKREMGTPDTRNLISVISWFSHLQVFICHRFSALQDYLYSIADGIYFQNVRTFSPERRRLWGQSGNSEGKEENVTWRPDTTAENLMAMQDAYPGYVLQKLAETSCCQNSPQSRQIPRGADFAKFHIQISSNVTRIILRILQEAFRECWKGRSPNHSWSTQAAGWGVQSAAESSISEVYLQHFNVLLCSVPICPYFHFNIFRPDPQAKFQEILTRMMLKSKCV